ncbi:MAG: peptide chain release factor 3 [Chloroflexi bacterium]|nr:peptide chain release factor 3 [Chloroflexota bacterium]
MAAKRGDSAIVTQPEVRPDEQLSLQQEVARRRTFAIISHPDAGKTTLTEKILLYAGAVELAGSVRRRKHQRHATSDWLAMEQERGISITSTALQFDYRGYRLNLLDTPGHQDFSEDTYRTLVAVDSAIMVLDHAKGIEPQTRKLFEVCRRLQIPILTFINKLDQPGQSPLALLDQIEQVLNIAAVPRSWPIGEAPSFQGVYDLERQQVLRFERTDRGQYRAPMSVSDLGDPSLSVQLGRDAHQQLQEEVELISAAGVDFDFDRFRAGELTPVFFGSALTNFGVEPFLDAFVHLAPPPRVRTSNCGPIEPATEAFSGIIFKIQATLDPQHRDRMAFLRICSGRFEKDLEVFHPRLRRRVRLSRAYRVFGRQRELVEEAYPGDVIGLVSPSVFAIGDTLSAQAELEFPPLPIFQPDHFGVLQNHHADRYKQFTRGLLQLEGEGAIQVLSAVDSARRESILAAVGELQFDVVLSRLRVEYGVEASVRRLPYTQARWIEGPPDALAGAIWPRGTLLALHNAGPVVLFETQWDLQLALARNPELRFETLS